VQVIKLDKNTCEEFVLNKHYSRSKSIFWAGFGLIEDNMITGIVVFGQPSPSIQSSAFKDRDFKLYELTRLVVQSKTKNASSYLVSNALKLLDTPCAVISYADSEYNHCGIIYQATNWLYTGATVSHDHLYLIDGKRVHSMTLRSKGITSPKKWAKDNNIETIKPSPKHRYFTFVGDKRQKKYMKSKLVYDVISQYPKCDQVRYDDGPEIKRFVIV
jgi:hypothetical protein